MVDFHSTLEENDTNWEIHSNLFFLFLPFHIFQHRKIYPVHFALDSNFRRAEENNDISKVSFVKSIFSGLKSTIERTFLEKDCCWTISKFESSCCSCLDNFLLCRLGLTRELKHFTRFCLRHVAT